MSEYVECVVVGAGVVGLACARALALSGKEVIILEAEDAIGTSTSARNSEVIHAGIYYPKGSAKARLCVTGKEMLYGFCQDHGVDFKRLGKLIVASTPDQVDKLAEIKEKAAANGVCDLTFLSQEEVAKLEPALQVEAALLSPSTGIVDSHALMLALLGEAESHGAMLALGAPLLSGKITDKGFSLEVGGDAPMTLDCRYLINSAGLSAVGLARAIDGLNPVPLPKAYFCKGNYFSLNRRAPFSHLIYPVPESAGLGVHLTLDLGGQAKFGPDVEWLDCETPSDIDYTVTPSRADSFYGAIRRYWPGLKDGELHADYSGVRPKIQAPGEEAKDFAIEGPSTHGIKGLINLFGIESPGLTSCLAIASEVDQMLA